MELKLMSLDKVVNSGVVHPEIIDYTRLGLYPKHYYTKGVITRTEYYFSYVSLVFSDLYVRVNFAYTINAGLYTDCTTTTEYIDLSEAVGLTVVESRDFTSQEIFEIEHSKRKNILAAAKVYISATLSSTDYYDLLETCATNIALYV
jgi:hypothetical protein